MSAVNHLKAKVAALSRSRDESDRELVEARRNLKAARIADHVRRQLEDGPVLTADQLHHIASVAIAGGGAR